MSAKLLTLRSHDGRPVNYPQPKTPPTFNASKGAGVSWAAWTWNPVTGCLHNCSYCYAREIATTGRFSGAYPAGFTPIFHPERLTAPANTRIPRTHREDPAWSRVFVVSMGDLSVGVAASHVSVYAAQKLSRCVRHMSRTAGAASRASEVDGTETFVDRSSAGPRSLSQSAEGALR